MAATALTIAAAFGLPRNVKDVADLVKDFDFSKINESTSISEEYLNFALAPSFGKLDSKSVKLMDENLKVIIAGTTRVMAKLKDKSWPSVLGSFKQNPLVQPIDEKPIDKYDSFQKSSTGVFKVDGSPDSGIVREVEQWFDKFISDSDVRKSTSIDINVLGKIVAASGASIDSFETFFLKNEYHEQTMLEIGVLRYPDIDQPYFKLYRIKLKAWSDSSRILFVQEDKNGITGEFQMQKFEPRDSVISAMSPQIKESAVNEAESIFG